MTKRKRVYKPVESCGAEFTISEQRIEQVTNDVAEDMKGTYTLKELRECVRYWSLLTSLYASKLTSDMSSVTCELALIAVELVTERKPPTALNVVERINKLVTRLKKQRV